MPLNLAPRDLSAELENVASVLIVSCPVCPPVSLAMEKKSPFLEVFKRGLKTGAFEDYIREIREPLEERGVRTGVFSTIGPLPTMCLWTKGQRQRLRKRAQGYEAVVVLGCDSAAYTARKTLEETECKVIQGMQIIGITNAVVDFQFPLTVHLEEASRVQAPKDAHAGSPRA